MKLDDGFQYGIGAFETIAVFQGVPLFLEQHLHRLKKALDFLGIKESITEKQVIDYLSQHPADGCLKIMVSDRNIIFTQRENPYQQEHYARGFTLGFSKIRRNESSPFTYHKTLNYGENIIAKREGKANGVDEILFLNTKGNVCEGSASNIFFVKNNQIFTPNEASGLLPGIVRDYILKTYDVLEVKIDYQEIGGFEECFITNSLMGIMPVKQLEMYKFDHSITENIMRTYQNAVNHKRLIP